MRNVKQILTLATLALAALLFSGFFASALRAVFQLAYPLVHGDFISGRAIDGDKVVGAAITLPTGERQSYSKCLVHSPATLRIGTGILQMSAPPAGWMKNGSRRLARASA